MAEATNSLSERQLNRLLRSIADGHCVLMLGPDIARTEDGPRSESLMAVLERELRQEVDSGPDLDGDVDSDDLQYTAQVYMRDADPRDLWMAVESFYDRFAEKTTAVHRDLAALPFSVCVQITPDRLMHNALVSNADKQPMEAYCHLREGTKLVGGGSAFGDPTPERPVVFGLHGHGSDGESVVLTENDLLDFLERLARDRTLFPSWLLKTFADEQTTFLFLGFGFHHWYQRLVLHLLRGKAVGSGKLLRSLALEGEQFFSMGEQAHCATFYKEEHKLEFANLSFADFASELRSRYEASAPQREQRAAIGAEPGNDAPIVFLSYDSRDEEQVEQLALELRARGLNAWRDHDNLRGGDDWNRVVRHVLQKQVDYVAVLHSPNLIARESYVTLEINLAQERRNSLPRDWRFIIPCHFLGGTEQLAALEEYQYIDLNSPADCDVLVGTIIDDWANNERLHAKRSKAQP